MIEKEMTGKNEFAYLLINDYLMNPAVAVASLINKSVKGAGTDEQMLNNITVLFSDYFRGNMIKEAYKQYGDVAKDLKGDLTGKYENAVLGMWGL